MTYKSHAEISKKIQEIVAAAKAIDSPNGKDTFRNLIVQADADVLNPAMSLRGDNNASILSNCAYRFQEQDFRNLVRKISSAAINSALALQSDANNTTLDVAVRWQSDEVLIELIEKASSDAINESLPLQGGNGMCALHSVLNGRKIKSSLKLIEKASSEAISQILLLQVKGAGWTALHLAAHHQEIVFLSLIAKASPASINQSLFIRTTDSGKKTAFDGICNKQSQVVISKILLIADDANLTEIFKNMSRILLIVDDANSIEIFKTSESSKILESLKILLIDQQQWQDNAAQLQKIAELTVKAHPELMDFIMDKYLDNQYPKQDSAIKILKNNLIYVNFLKYSDEKIEKLLKELIGKDISLELVNKKISHTAENTLLRRMAWRSSKGLRFILENVTDKKGLYRALKEVAVGDTILQTAKNTATRLKDTETPKILRHYELFYYLETAHTVGWVNSYMADFKVELAWDDMTFLGHAVRYGYTDLATTLMENENSKIILSKENIQFMVDALTKNKEAFCLAVLESAAEGEFRHIVLGKDLAYADLDAFKPLYAMAKRWKYGNLKHRIETLFAPPVEQQPTTVQQQEQQQPQPPNSVAKKFNWLDAATTTVAINGTAYQVGFFDKWITKIAHRQTPVDDASNTYDI